MKASDEEEYGTYYSSRAAAAARYRYGDYSPNRGHHSSSSSSANMGDHYSIPPPPTGGSSSAAAQTQHSSRNYSRTPPYAGSRTMMEYAPPPCCHQFYHPPPPPLPLHPSPSHFNTVPHPPLQYRDVQACTTLNRSYNRRSNNHPYATYYATESPYGDPRSDIYYTSTLTRHPRHSASGVSSSSSSSSATRGGGSNSSAYPGGDHDSGVGSSVASSSKIYDTPGGSTLPHSSSAYHHPQHHHSGRTYAPAPLSQHGSSSLMRLEEPRIYASSAALHLGGSGNPGAVAAAAAAAAASTSSLQRSSSPQHHYVDRSISLIRLDNSGASGGTGSSSNVVISGASLGAAANESGSSHGASGSSVTLSTGGTQPRFVIKFTPEMQSQTHHSSTSGTGMMKTSIECGSSSDPLGGGASSITPNKPKFKLTTLENQTHSPSIKPVVEMLDKCVMTSQLPEQWSLVSTGSEGRRISLGATSPPGSSPPAPTLAGGVPDLLPSCVVRHAEYPSNNPWRSSGGNNLLPSPRRNMYHGGNNGGNMSCGQNPSGQICSSQMAGSSRSSGNYGQHYHHHGSGNGNNGGNSGQLHNSGLVSGSGRNNGSYPSSAAVDNDSKWGIVRRWIRGETQTFFGLQDTHELKEEWLSRRKRFASRRYSERNVDSMPPPSPYHGPCHRAASGGPPYQQYQQSHSGHFGHGFDNVDNSERLDSRMGSGTSARGGSSATRSTRRTRKKDNIFVVYWNLLRWIFWSIRFGRTGQRVAAGAGCGSDTYPGASSITPGRVPLDSQISRDRTKSRSVTPTTLSELPPSVTISPQELFFDDVEDNHRNSTHHLQPPGRGLHWRIARMHPAAGGPLLSNYKIPAQFLNKVLDNSERQQFRQGLRQPTSTISKLALIDEYEDFRPYFTYWISLVQIIILITIMIIYGLAPVKWDMDRKSSLVLVTSLSLQQMEVIQPANFWIGPSASDLIHLGAKFAPCMRRDEVVWRRIVETRDRERETACCIRNDNSGCVQSSRSECSIKGNNRAGLLSTWKKWTRKEGPGGRISGSVCGLDPKYCEAPASIAPYEWPDDITKWPICRKTRGLSGMSPKDKTAEHMVCEVIGHPCCIGIHAKCLITTREYCRFVNGYFHEEASLCSQVSCLQDVCGMFPFIYTDHPDQFYRLISSLFLHAGLGHILFTLFFHWFIMRDLEKLAGPLRIAIIYLGCGIAGNLGSVLLDPHRAEVGPGGSLFGLLACLLVELLHMWGMLRRPWQALGKMVLVTGGLFLLGFLPWVDNFAHISGFVVGFLLSHAIMPYVSFGKYSTYRKWLEVVICLLGYFVILVTLLIVFYVGFGDCHWCRLLNCIPLTKEFCAEQEIDFRPSGGGINLIT